MLKKVNPFGFKSHGVKNFFFVEEHPNLKLIYLYLARPKISSVKSREEADTLIRQFCKHELGFSGAGLQRCANRVQRNWSKFAEAVEMHRSED